MYSVSGTDLGAVPWTDQSADSFGRLLPPADSGGIRDQSGGKAGALVRWMVCICLLMGTLGFSLLICWIHLRFPVNETLLRMIFPFLFIQQNPVGILRLDVQIGLWLIPLVLLGEGLWRQEKWL